MMYTLEATWRWNVCNLICQSEVVGLKESARLPNKPAAVRRTQSDQSIIGFEKRKWRQNDRYEDRRKDSGQNDGIRKDGIKKDGRLPSLILINLGHWRDN